MGKKEEKQLLEAAIKGDKDKIEKLLYPKHKPGQPIPQLEREDVKSFRMKVSVAHINVDCRNEGGSTPLILAVLNGHKAIAALFVMHSCSVNAQDACGNTAMHWAAFNNQLDVVDMLVKAHVPADIPNNNGEYPLHFAIRNFQAGKPFVVVRLLQGGATASAKNKDGDTSLVLAARLDKREAVLLLVDADLELVHDSKPMVEAARTGHLEVMRALLDSCFDPNGLDESSGSRPLHEAVRFFRIKIAELLVSFGADSKLKNSCGETAELIAEQHPGGKGEEFLAVFEDYKTKPLIKPKAEVERERRAVVQSAKTREDFDAYMRSSVNWTCNQKEYRSSSVSAQPVMNLLDNDPRTLYSMRGAQGNWVILDFHCVLTLHRLRLYGWDSPQMVKNFQLFAGESLEGPWQLVKSFRAERIGSTVEMEAGVPQEFGDFFVSSQFVKLAFLDNYGSDIYTSLHGIDFFGKDAAFEPFLAELGLGQYYRAFLANGLTQLTELAVMPEDDLKVVVPLPGHFKRLARALKKISSSFSLRNMWWLQEPPTVAMAGDKLPDIVVKIDPMASAKFMLIALGNAPISGNTCQRSVCHGVEPATVTFSGLSIAQAGTFLFEVHVLLGDPAESPVFLQASSQTTVRSAVQSDLEIDRAFQRMISRLNV